MTERRVCKVEGCGRAHSAHGYCGRHANQFRAHGRVIAENELRGNFVRPCSVPGCEARHSAKGYCNRHAKQMATHGRIMPDIVKARPAKVARSLPVRRVDPHSWSFEPERCQQVSVAAMPGVDDGDRYRQVPFVLPVEFRCPDRSGKIKRRDVRREA